MKISCPVFPNQGMIPMKYSCDGENVSPPLNFLEVPKQAVSLILIVDDPNTQMGVWDHWLVWNIKPDVVFLEENKVPQGAVQGLNSFGFPKYGGPCPSAGTHSYFFKLFALDIELPFHGAVPKDQLIAAMNGHVIDRAELIGRYHR